MKIHVTMIVLSLISQTLLGQLQKGDVFLGGGLSVEHSSTFSPLIAGDRLPSTQLSLSPSIGFVTAPRIAFGGGLGYTLQKTSSLYTVGDQAPMLTIAKNTSHIISANVFMRYYTKVTEKAGFIIQPSIGGSYYQMRTKVEEVVYKSDGFSADLSVNPVIYYFVNEHICLEAGLGGLNVNYSGNDSSGINQDTVGIDLSLYNSLSFAFRYFIGKGSSD